MATPLNTYDEYKNWIWVNHQKQVPVEADKMNIQAQSLKDHIRRAVCELIGNGAKYDGFFIDTTNKADPTIKAGSIFIAGHKLDLETDVLYSEQPWHEEAPPITDPDEGFYYLSVVEEEIDQTDDPEIVDPELGVECVKPHRLHWVVKYLEFPVSLPTPADNEYVMALYIETSTPPFESADVRNTGNVDAGVNTRYQDREGGRLGGGHGHYLVDTWVVTLPSGDPEPDYTTSDFQAVMDDIVARLRDVESNPGINTYALCSGDPSPVQLPSEPAPYAAVVRYPVTIPKTGTVTYMAIHFSEWAPASGTDTVSVYLYVSGVLKHTFTTVLGTSGSVGEVISVPVTEGQYLEVKAKITTIVGETDYVRAISSCVNIQAIEESI